MSVIVRQRTQGWWQADIRFRLPDGSLYREKKKAPATSKSGAQRWGEERERYLVLHGPPRKRKEVPTVQQFADRFVREYAIANQQKPSEIASKRGILNRHLIPAFGARQIDAITNGDVQALKHALRNKAPKTVNNILTVLSVMLRKAVEWGVIDQMPCTIRLLKSPRKQMGFWDFNDYEQLVAAAERLDSQTHLMILLGGDAGLRCGEIIGLEWQDVNFGKRQLCVQRSDWRGHVTAPKGGRLRYVPMTARLASALEAFRHARCARVFCRDDSAFTQDMVGDRVRRAAKAAGVSVSGAHRLRHTFCSHLAMRGAPARAIQEAAGHQDLLTTQRYMHLSPGAVEDAIRLLEHSRRFA